MAICWPPGREGSRVLYAILDGTQDRALTEILRIRKIPGHPKRSLFIRLKPAGR